VAELRARGIEAEDIPGEKSQFDVVRDGELVFSKQQEGRFPEHDEVVGLLSAD
jgi:predicted Rdx family selenoprotein